jgi:hypothetical protein
MTERTYDNPKDYNKATGELQRIRWNKLLNALQIHNTFIHQGGLKFSWNNGQVGHAW